VDLKPFESRIDLERVGFRFGEHTGDWEHVALHINNYSSSVDSVFLSQHGKGQWLRYEEMEMQAGRPRVYASLHGHANYATPGDHQTSDLKVTTKDIPPVSLFPEKTTFEFALRNEAGLSQDAFDCGKYQLIAADFLGASKPQAPAWLDYPYRWGPHIFFTLGQWEDFLKHFVKIDFPGITDLVALLAKELLARLSSELKEENGPTGPKQKGEWAHFETA